MFLPATGRRGGVLAFNQEARKPASEPRHSVMKSVARSEAAAAAAFLRPKPGIH